MQIILIAEIFWVSSFGFFCLLISGNHADSVVEKLSGETRKKPTSVIEDQIVESYHQGEYYTSVLWQPDRFFLHVMDVRYGSESIKDSLTVKICAPHDHRGRKIATFFLRHDFDTKIVIWKFEGEELDFIESECKNVTLYNEGIRDKYHKSYGPPTELQFSKNYAGKWTYLDVREDELTNWRN